MAEGSVRDPMEHMPLPVDSAHPDYLRLYRATCALARDHIKHLPGMPDSPYMDEGFCATQLWIWDSCFMSLFCKYAPDVFPGVETLDNFYQVLYDGKRFPTIIAPEGEPSWTNAVPGEPFEIKLHIADNPPLFAWAEYENALMSGDRGHIEKLLYEHRYLQQHYEWIEGLTAPEQRDNWSNPTCLISEPCGCRWEGGRSGMDNTPRGRTGAHALRNRPNNPDMLWLDILCQQALSAKSISRLFGILCDEAGAAEWAARFEEKKNLVNALYWDADDEFYYDIDRNTHEFIKVKTIASYWALTSETADKAQAAALVKLVSDPEAFGGSVPLVSLARNDADFSPSGSYWRGSLWLPTAYAALKGMAAYGYICEARAAAERILEHMYKTWLEYEPHTVWECYSPTEPRPATQPDGKTTVRGNFCGWSALGPILIYIEFVLGFYSVDAFTNTVKWARPAGRAGIKNLRFGQVVTDIISEGETCRVTSNKAYTLVIDGADYAVTAGENCFRL